MVDIYFELISNRIWYNDSNTHAYKTHKNRIRRLKWKWGFISTFNPNNLVFAIDYQCSIWNSLITMSSGCCKLWARVKFTNIIEWIRQFRIPVEFVAMSAIAHNRQAIGIADLWKWNEIRPNECGVDLSAKAKCRTITKKNKQTFNLRSFWSMPMYLLYRHADAVANNVGDFFPLYLLNRLFFFVHWFQSALLLLLELLLFFLRFVC